MSQTIRDIMTRDVESARPDQSALDVAQIMKSRDIGSVPVVQDKKVDGVITDRDILLRTVAEGKDPASTKVGDIMSKEVVTVREDADLREAGQLMHDHQLRRLPVVNAQGELVGYLALAKVARTESPEQAGRVIKGVSEAAKPAPMPAARKRRPKQTG